MDTLRALIGEHPFFQKLDAAHLDLIVGCGRNVRFDRDQYLFREGDSANDFFLIRHGAVALELRPHHHPVVVKTLHAGEILGWSWLIPPHAWTFDARAMELTRAVALDGVCLRGKCEKDHELGFELLKRFASEIEKRLHGAWMQMADIYGKEHI
jgi:CRP-like cAMP-binding protein